MPKKMPKNRLKWPILSRFTVVFSVVQFSQFSIDVIVTGTGARAGITTRILIIIPILFVVSKSWITFAMINVF